MRALARHPLFLGLSAAVLLSVWAAIWFPEEDMKKGAAFAASFMIFFVPLCLLTAYALRSAFRFIRVAPQMRRAWLALVLLLTAFTTIDQVSAWREARRYRMEGRSVWGTVQETHPEAHNTLLVAYSAAGKDFRVSTQGPRSARSYKPGESIQVYYPASEPAHSFLFKPQWTPVVALPRYILAAVLIPLWMVGLFSLLAGRFMWGGRKAAG